MHRRRFLATFGAVALPFAGCLAGGSTDPSSNRTETGTPTAGTSSTTPRPAQYCENGGELVDEYEVTYETFAGFELTASKETVTRGEQITFQLENVTTEEKMTGVRSKYTIHRKTEAGWRDIFYPAEDSTGHPGYNDLGIIQPPGEGFTWELTFSQSGLAHDIEEGVGSLDVCTPLQSSTYRFVYWGVVGDPETSDDSDVNSALGVRFSVSET